MTQELSPAAIRDVLENWSRSAGPLYRRLAGGFRAAIDTARLPAGTMLPPERSLAATLGLSRSTVAAAFEELKRSGHLEARQGSGTWVRDQVRPADEGNVELVEELEDHAIVRDIRAVPSLTVEFTVAAMAAAPEVNAAIALMDPAVLARWTAGHGYNPQGIGELREAVAKRLTGTGLPTTAEQVLITAGATQAIHLAAQLFLQERTAAVVETPTSAGALDALLAARARLFPVDVDADGVRVDQLTDVLERVQPRLVYLVPDFHNPTGAVLSDERRREIARLAGHHHVPVVEDIVQRDLWFAQPPPPPIASYEPDAPILTVGSMSKIFWGGLRVGWIRSSERVIARLARLKAVTDMGSPILAQALSAHLLNFSADDVIACRRQELQVRLAALLEAGAVHLPDWELNQPAGGLSVWAKLPLPLAEEFARRAPEFGTAVVPGVAFAVEHHRHAARVRLPFTAAPAVVEEGVRRLASTWAALHQGGPDEAAGAIVA